MIIGRCAMKLFFRIIFKIFLILTILAGCETNEQIKETDPVALFNQGAALLEEDQYDRAIAYFSKVIEINPRADKIYFIRGVAYDKKGQYDKAISDYNKAIEINPRYAEAYNNRGVAYYHKARHDIACSDWKRACELGFCEGYEWAKRKDVCQ